MKLPPKNALSKLESEIRDYDLPGSRPLPFDNMALRPHSLLTWGMNHGRAVCSLPVLAAIGVLLAAPMIAWALSNRAGPQRRDQEKAESRAQPRSVFTLTVEKVPQSSVIRCVKDELEQQGWRVLPFKKDKRQLLAFRNVEAGELGRVADTKRGAGTIHWVRGRVDLILSFSAANHNTTSVDLRARILAQGETSRSLLRPMNWWPLPSTGALEGDVVAALKVQCGTPTKSRPTGRASLRLARP